MIVARLRRLLDSWLLLHEVGDRLLASLIWPWTRLCAYRGAPSVGRLRRLSALPYPLAASLLAGGGRYWLGYGLRLHLALRERGVHCTRLLIPAEGCRLGAGGFLPALRAAGGGALGRPSLWR